MKIKGLIIKAASGAFVLSVLVIALTGCMDVEYKYDVPRGQDDCPAGMDFRDGGSSIRDRDGGSNIRDRDGDTVSAYCEEADCPTGGTWSSDPAVIDWHLNKGEHVIANRKCITP